MSTVICLLGAAGTGKSTTAHGLSYLFKKNLLNVEYVPEYAKSKAWEGQAITEYDQLGILGKQWKYESRLYGKADVIVTDAPFILSSFYEKLYHGTEYSLSAATGWMDRARRNGVNYLFFLLGPVENFDPRGRFQNKEQSKEEGLKLKAWLDSLGISYHLVAGDEPDSRVKEIYDIFAAQNNLPEISELSAQDPDARGDGFVPGYHARPIVRGVLGELSKIQEEMDELTDAVSQGVKIMELVELSDLTGAVERYLERHHIGTTLDDLRKMQKVTRRAFENGRRK